MTQDKIILSQLESFLFKSRFREWCPETGKKAHLMFVQHMLVSVT
jgi:type I restriction enzyme M protein